MTVITYWLFFFLLVFAFFGLHNISVNAQFFSVPGNTTHTTINASTPEDIISEMEKALSVGNLEPKVAEKMVNDISKLLNSSKCKLSSMSKRYVSF